MICPRCSVEAPATSLFCGSCGAPLPVRPNPGDEDGGVTLLPSSLGQRDGGVTGLPTPLRSSDDGGTTLLPSSRDDDSPTAFGGPSTPPPVGRDRVDDGDDGGVTVAPGTKPGAAGSDTGPLTPGQSFGPRYRIIKLLGLGGMGAVYQAWDAELGVVVALKVIRPEAAADDPTAARDLERRFKRELLLARQVTHKNVVRIHDLGELGGIKYITMPHLEGEDLATILEREGRLGVPRTLAIARGVLSGLAAAHQAGVVHRDLKPANIMICENDEPLIMDFGIARSTGDAAGARTGAELPDGAGEGLTAGATSAGEIVGTVEYMAPEQARGEAADRRADIYAVGLILYDMLLGRRRHEHANGAIAELRGRLETPPPPPRTVDEVVPEAVDRIITRCMATKVEDRYQTTQELVAELERLDADGKPLPSQRRLIHAVVASAVVLLVAMVALNWWLVRSRAPAKAHDPVTVLIADFDNRAHDSSFNGALEPVLKLALEGAGFVSAYDRAVIRRNLGVRPPEKLDERAAQEIAVKQGVSVVLSGAVERQGNGYAVSVKATQAVTGKVIIDTRSRASSKDKVLSVATDLATKVREALGDESASDSGQRFAMDTLSAASMEAVRDYADGQVSASDGKFEAARASFLKAVERDPKFGLGWAALAMQAKNLDDQQDAERYIKEAIRHVDRMTERERYRTRGNYYYITGDYQACVKEYGDLLARYAADAAAHNNLALCSTYLRNVPKAQEEMKQAVRILPKRALYRVNLALYANYAGDFQTGEREARAIATPGVFGLLALAFAQVGQGQLAQAAETYQAVGRIDAQGASYAASGLGDLAVYQGRFKDAVRLFTDGAAEDLRSKDVDRAAVKLASLAQVQLLRNQKNAAIAAASHALDNSKSVRIRFLTARVFVEAGDMAKARPLIASLASEFQAEPQAYAKILEGEAALKRGDDREAVKVLTEANALLDTWIGHFDLGRAYLGAGAFPQADSEFDRCIKRRGEAVSLFLDEEPTYASFPPVYYYQGRVREGLNSERYTESYRAYLAIRGQSTEDPLVADARRRASK
jgi:eukaryotic-like serine/threonine-protein kinase